MDRTQCLSGCWHREVTTPKVSRKGDVIPGRRGEEGKRGEGIPELAKTKVSLLGSMEA